MLWPKRKEVAHRKKKNGFMLSCNDKIRIKTRFDMVFENFPLTNQP